MSLARPGGGIDTPTATSSLAYEVHALQDQLSEGPLWDPRWAQSTIQVDD